MIYDRYIVKFVRKEEKQKKIKKDKGAMAVPRYMTLFVEENS